MLVDFNEMLYSNISSGEKLQSYLNLENNLSNFLIGWNRTSKSNIEFKITKSNITNVVLEHCYSNLDIKKNNLKLLLISLKNLLSPNKAQEEYSTYYNEEENYFCESEPQKFQVFLESIFNTNINTKNITIINEDKIKFLENTWNSRKEKEIPNKFYAFSIFQPSFECLNMVASKIDLLDYIEFRILNNQEEETRNNILLTVFPTGKGERAVNRDGFLPPTTKNLIKNLYLVSKPETILNINLEFVFKRELNFQEEMVVKYLFETNGIFIQQEPCFKPKSITTFDFLNLMNNVKVNI